MKVMTFKIHLGYNDVAEVALVVKDCGHSYLGTENDEFCGPIMRAFRAAYPWIHFRALPGESGKPEDIRVFTKFDGKWTEHELLSVRSRIQC